MSTISLFETIDHIDELAVCVTSDWEIVALNAAAASFFGLEQSTSVGKHLLRVCSDNKLSIPESEIKRALEIGGPVDAESELDTKLAGKLCWRLSPIKNSPSQEIVMIAKRLSGEDVSRQEDREFFVEQLKEITGQDVKKNLSLPVYASMIRHYYERLIDHMPHNVYWLNKDCVTLGCNQNVLRLIGLTKKEQFVGITYNEMGKLANWSEGQADSFKRDDMEAMRTNTPKKNIEEPALYSDDNEPVYYLSSREPLYDDAGEVIGVIGISVDITDKKKAQELAKQREISEKVISRLKTIAGSLSHEIRTPLTGLKLGLTGLKRFFSKGQTTCHRLEQKATTPDVLPVTAADFARQEVAIDKMLSHIDMSANFLEIQLKNMLTENIDTSEFSQCDIKTCVLESLSAFSFPPALSGDCVSVTIDESFSFWGDVLLLRHVLWNLLNNALHFIREEGRGEIFIMVTQKGDENILSFKDTAKGMANAEASKVFNRYYTKRTNGTGLGLNFCQLVMESFDGGISCQAEEGKYAEFLLSFPRRPSPVMTE